MYHLQHMIAPKHHSLPLISTYSYPEGNVLLSPPSMLKTSSLSKVDVLAKFAHSNSKGKRWSLAS